MDTFSNYQEANRIFWRNTVVPSSPAHEASGSRPAKPAAAA